MSEEQYCMTCQHPIEDAETCTHPHCEYISSETSQPPSGEVVGSDQACINIYLSLHVSQLREVSKQIREAWEAGQRLYADKINNT